MRTIATTLTLLLVSCGGPASEGQGDAAGTSSADDGGQDGSAGPGDGLGDGSSAADTTASSSAEGGSSDSDGGQVDIPSAIEDLELFEWGSISMNTLADVDPCPRRDCAWSAVEGQSGVIEDWTGGAFASEEGGLGGLVYWGGGHGGYYGNEVYFFDIETLLWGLRSDPTDGQTPGDASTYGIDLSTGLWWDDTPVATHTYDGVSYHPGTNSFMLLTSGDSPAEPWVPSSFAQPYAHRFSFTDGVWVPGGSPNPGVDGFVSSSYDAARDWFWIWSYPDSFLASYDPNADSWIAYDQDFLTGLDHVSEIHPDLDVFVTLEFRGSGNVLVHDLSNPNAAAVAVQTQGDTAIESVDALGFEWVDELDAFVAWGGGQSVHTFTAPAGDWRTEPWEWTEVQGSGANPGPAPMNGAYTKFQYAPTVGVALVAPSRESNVFAIRLAE